MSPEESRRRAESVRLRIADCRTPHQLLALLENAIRLAHEDGAASVRAGDGFRAAMASEHLAEAHDLLHGFGVGVFASLEKLSRRCGYIVKHAEAGNSRAVAMRTVGELLPAIDRHIRVVKDATERLVRAIPDVACEGKGRKA